MLIIKTKSRTTPFSWMLYSLFGLFCLVGAPVAWISTFLKNKEEALVILPAFAVQLIIGLLCLRMILWFIQGEEGIYLEGKEWHFTKTGTFGITRLRVIPIQDVKKIELHKTFFEEMTPSDLVSNFRRKAYLFKIQNTGRIKLTTHQNKTFKFLDNCSPEEAQNIRAEMIKQSEILVAEK